MRAMRLIATSMGALVLAALLATLMACGDSGARDRPTSKAADPERALSVYVVNRPLQYFAERIGGEHVTVVFPAPADVDPADWSPSPEIVAAYQRADVILLNGAGYASWVSRASLPQSAIVNTGAAFADRLIPVDRAVTHSHGPEGAHEHGEFAVTTWLDPTLAIEQARAVAHAFEASRPAHAPSFRRSFDELAEDLEELDRRLAAVARTLGSEPLLFSHPVYQYLIRRYRLNGQSLHWEPEGAPDYDELQQSLVNHAARWVIWESDPRPATIEALEAAGIASVVFAPGGGATEAGDWLDEMNRNVSRLEAGPAGGEREEAREEHPPANVHSLQLG